MKSDWFLTARFGLFIHWGLYAIPAEGEWIYARRKWQRGQYENLMHHFNPTDFNPEQWAARAREAGMGYLVFTTKHHDGFCLFDSHYTDYKITNTPYGKDVTRMLADACRKQGLKVGFYHSLPDWTHPGYADTESPEYIQNGTLHTPTAKQHRDFLQYLYDNVHQLMTEYGQIDLLFFDYTSQTKIGMDYFGRDRILDMVYREQPQILVNDRLAYFKDDVRDFDYYTPEVCVMNRPPLVKGRDAVWETCATMNEHWGYVQGDENYKSTETITAALMGCVSQNGNLLLNVGPDQKGNLPPGAIRTLENLARWNRVNGESVKGCGRSFFHPPFGCCYTQKDQELYCYLLCAPIGDIILPELKNRIQQVTLLRTGEEATLINGWGRELLKADDQRIRIRGARAGDVLKITLATARS